MRRLGVKLNLMSGVLIKAQVAQGDPVAVIASLF